MKINFPQFLFVLKRSHSDFFWNVGEKKFLSFFTKDLVVESPFEWVLVPFLTLSLASFFPKIEEVMYVHWGRRTTVAQNFE